ncbi:MAG: hypothetical protein J6W29_04045, partial [Neisseriaceae bacterium]|nr:hypothetical protein [Neisseriaceae bacterium]
EAAKNKGIESCILEKDDQTGADINVGPGWSGWSSVNLSEVPNYTPSNPQQPAGNTDDCGVSVVTNGASKAEKRTCSYDYNETNVYQWSKVTPYQGGSAVIQLRAENGGRIIHKKNIGFQFLLNNADLGSYLYGTDSAYISSKIYPDSINTISIFSQNITDYSQNHAGQHRSGDDETLGNLTKQHIDCLQGKDNLGYIAGSEGYKETVKLGEVYCESPKVVRRISWREIF